VIFVNHNQEAKNVVKKILILKDAILARSILEEKAVARKILYSLVVILAKQILDQKNAANSMKNIHLVIRV
jgi:hypothetical protein